MLQARKLQQALRHLLEQLPRLGLLSETCQLLEAARLMEANNPVGPGSISDYDRLFSVGYEALVESLVDLSEGWIDHDDEGRRDAALVECLEPLTESLLQQWLAHGRTLRLSSLEKIGDDKAWQSLKKFIADYGHELFTQKFLNLGNLRAILHQGVDTWLASLAEMADDEETEKLRADLDAKLPRREAVQQLTLVIEAIAENYSEYRDYNSTTTQSDRGELLYMLLDFLRLRVRYDRIAWHLKPLLLAHGALVRRGRSAAAETWRRTLAERTSEMADTLQNQAEGLRKAYAMRLPTVTDRLSERFTRPLSIDRVRVLVGPAMRAARAGAEDATSLLHQLEHEIDELAQEPSGIGLELPDWLEALEQEVTINQRMGLGKAKAGQSASRRPQIPLSLEQVQRQLTDWERQEK